MPELVKPTARALCAAALVAVLSSAGCSGCHDESSPSAGDAGPASSGATFHPPKAMAEPFGDLDFAATPETLVFRDRQMVSGGQRTFALPSACREIRRQRVASVPPSASIEAAARSRPSLRLTAATGDELSTTPAGIIDLGETGAPPPPIPLPTIQPRITDFADGAWRGMTTAATDGGSSPILWTRRGGEDPEIESLGSGDGFRAVDLACSSERCALLTTRKGSVLRAGGTLWSRPLAGGAFDQWDIEPTDLEANLVPFGIAHLGQDVVIAFERAGKAELWTLRPGQAPTLTATLPAPGGLAAAIALPTPVTLSRNQPLPERGCRPGLGLTLERPDKPAIMLSAPVQPTMASIRPLSKGALVTWLTPLRCEADQPSLRRVLYALVLDEHGEPVGSVIPITDTWQYAVTTHGDEVDLWLRAINPPDDQPPDLVWLRLSCSGAAQ